MSCIPENERDISVLLGFLSSAAERNAEATAAFLDDAVDNPILMHLFPIFQTVIKLDEKGAARIEESIRLGVAPAHFYGDLWRTSDSVPMDTLRRLILAIVALPDGYEVAVNILGMLLHNARGAESRIDDELIRCGRDLVRCCTFEKPGHTLDYHLGELVTACFGGGSAAEVAAIVCRQLQAAFSDYRSHSYDYKHLLESLFRMQPMIALDVFLGDPSEESGASLWDFDFDRQNPVEMLSDDTLITWAERDPEIRFAQLASAITPFIAHHEGSDYEWKPIALQILNLAPDRIAILNRFAAHLIPSSWCGSLADTIESRRALIRDVMSYDDPHVVVWAREKDMELSRVAQNVRRTEWRSDESLE